MITLIIKKLNERQVAGKFHPKTCVNYHNGDRNLIATPNGWVCDKCDYTQNFSESDLNVLNNVTKN